MAAEPFLCERCGAAVVDRTGSHALCCAAPEGTRGHYAVRDALLPLVHLADPSAQTEVPELIPTNPALRPADILTSAVAPGSLAALDVGVCSPDASGAGADCCDAMWVKKSGNYAEHFPVLAHTGVRYMPLVFSCYGRAHLNTDSAMEQLARQAARRTGFADHRPLLRRARAAVGVALWRRAAAMVTACLPRLSQDCLRVLYGACEDDDDCLPGASARTERPREHLTKRGVVLPDARVPGGAIQHASCRGISVRRAPPDLSPAPPRGPRAAQS